MESKKSLIAVILLEIVSLEESIRLTNGDSCNDKALVCWSCSVFETSTALEIKSINISISGSEHALVGIKV